MDFKTKYLKYKNKYLELKNGMNKVGGDASTMFEKIKNMVKDQGLKLSFEGNRTREVQENSLSRKFTFNDIYKFSADVTYNEDNDKIQLNNITNLNKDMKYPVRKFNQIDGNSDCMADILRPLGYSINGHSAKIENPKLLLRTYTNIFLSSINETSPTIIN